MYRLRIAGYTTAGTTINAFNIMFICDLLRNTQLCQSTVAGK